MANWESDEMVINQQLLDEIPGEEQTWILWI